MPAPLTRRAAQVLDLPPREKWPYALPGGPRYAELRWRHRLRTAPILTPEEHAQATGLRDIEEPIGCSLCGERRMQALFHARHPDPARWAYHVVRCPSCGLLYRHPGVRPDRVGELYTNSYSSFLGGRYGRKRRRRYRMVMRSFTPFFRHGEGRRLLDFGCGNGLFLDIAYKRGFDPYGVDLSEDSIEVARSKPSGRNAYFGSPRDVPEIAAGGFDVITMWSVLAHLATPVEDLTMLRSLLRPDGALLILTVNANSLELKAWGRHWNGFTPTHLKFYAPATLRLLLKRAGFEAVTFRPWYGEGVERGRTRLSPRNEERLRRAAREGQRGNMMRALAWADASAPARYGLKARRL